MVMECGSKADANGLIKVMECPETKNPKIRAFEELLIFIIMEQSLYKNKKHGHL